MIDLQQNNSYYKAAETPTKYLFSGLKEQKKKRIIALLLFIACAISGYMLIYLSSGGAPRQLEGLAHADSLIHSELSDFNIGSQQLREVTTRIDSNFSRKTYHVGVPYQFSKTQFHAELNRRFHPYSVQTPAKVTFPEENMDIHLLFQNTVIRTISLETDPELSYNQNRISLLVVFDELPDEGLINRLKRMGEPIPIVLKIQNPMQANEFRKEIGGEYDRIIYWLLNSEGEDLINVDTETAISKLNQMQQVLPEAVMMHSGNSEQGSRKDKKQLIAKTRMTFVDATNALMLHEEMGKAIFQQSLEKLKEKSSRSMAVISGNSTTLSWLHQKLLELKKTGTAITAPPKTTL